MSLPSDNSDYSLPGRIEDGDVGYVPTIPQSGERPKSKGLVLAGIFFAIVSVGFFAYYFINQEYIDSEILDNTIVTLDEHMASQYDIGQFGSAHAHAAIVVFAVEDKMDFSKPDFQLKSKYIHFENGNPYQIHKHATGVPLDMLFLSFGIKLTQDCLRLNFNDYNDRMCTGDEYALRFFVNGKEKHDISEYEIEHGDRILINYGDSSLIKQKLRYLNSLEIYEIPKSERLTPGKDILI